MGKCSANHGSFSDKTTSTPCTHHSPACDLYGKNCACNSYEGAIQCLGFAKMLTKAYYGSTFGKWSKTTNTNAIKAGDVISLKGVCSGSIFSEILGTTSVTFKRATLK